LPAVAERRIAAVKGGCWIRLPLLDCEREAPPGKRAASTRSKNGIASRASAGLGEELLGAEEVAGDPIELASMVKKMAC